MPSEAQWFAGLRHCVWPGCHEIIIRSHSGKDPLPLCDRHAYMVVQRYIPRDNEAELEAANLAEQARRDRREGEAKARSMALLEAVNQTGQIYYVRLNDVIKIGFSKQLHVRLRDYTTGVKILAHHPGTRADERDLHRTFRPFLVHGREWYRGDAQILLDHIAAVVAEWGPPKHGVERSAHKGNPVGHKHWTGKRGA